MYFEALERKELTIQSVRTLTNDFKEIVFESGHNIQYKAGQFLTFLFHNGLRELRRSYSITSSPVLQEPLAIAVKRVVNGEISRMLVDKAKAGDKLTTIGAAGMFTIPNDIDLFKTIYLFAAGSGIGPVYGILRTALLQHNSLKLVLVYSNHNKETTAYYSELQQLIVNYGERLTIHFLFSNSLYLQKAHLNRGYIFDLLDQYKKEDALFFICGPAAYMRLCRYTLQEAGVSSSFIRQEEFFNEHTIVVKPAPPDKEAHEVTIERAASTLHFKVQFPDSILAAAQKAGLSLPFSCNAGRCGTCAALCIEGNVWHSVNEVLTEQDVASGLVLTCTGHPVGGNVILKF
jgi:ferredoxin-NADP reductase